MKKIRIFFVTSVLLLLFNSCVKEHRNEEGEPNNLKQTSCNCNEEAFPDVKGERVTLGKGEKSITIIKKGNVFSLGGDILLTKEQVNRLRKDYEGGGETTKTAFIKNKTWPNATIPYIIDPSLPNQNRITQAIAYWNDNTMIQLVPRTTQSNYVVFVSGSGCSSYVGMIGGAQPIYMDNSCSAGNARHEIGHAVGLFHEHSRYSRQDYIDIHYENIMSDKQSNFDYYSNGIEYEVFDFNSVMLYGSDAFSKNGKPTMTKKDGTLFVGQRDSLSRRDIDGVNYLYLGNPNGWPFARIEFDNVGEQTSQPNSNFQLYADYYIAFYTTYHANTSMVPDQSIVFKYKSQLCGSAWFSNVFLIGNPVIGNLQNTNGASRIFLGRYPFEGISEQMEDPQYGYFTENYRNDFTVEEGHGYNIVPY